MEYYQRLKNLREDSDKSQKEIAEFLGTEQSYYAKYENAKHPIPNTIIKKLCLYYGVSADYILCLPEGLKYIKR